MGFFSSIGKVFKNVVSPVVDTVGSIVGIGSGVANAVSGHNANKTNQALNEANFKLAQDQFQFQKDYVKNRLQWQVEDAKKAGLHPMAAAGLSATSFSPVSTSSIAQQPLDYSFVNDLGQSLDYAATKGKSRPEQAQMIKLQLRGLELDNEYKQAQIDSLKADTLASSIASNQALESPASPSLSTSNLIGGQGDAPIKQVPDEVIMSGGNPSVTAGTHPLWAHARSGDFTVPVLSDKLADAITENKEKHFGAELSYALSAWNGKVKPPENAFTPHERYLLKTGEYVAIYYPLLGWRVEPRVNAENFRKFINGGYRRGTEIRGKIVR